MNPEISQLLDNYQKDGLVFKSCNTYIVVLQKLKDTITNEERNVNNKNRAKYRGNIFRVVDIVSKIALAFTIDTDKKQEEYEINEVISDYTNDFIYYKNEIIECKDYNHNTEKVCSTGIHYYLLWSTAFHHNLYKIILDEKYKDIYTGKSYDWYEDGNPLSEINYLNGKQHGIEKEWHSNGNLKSIQTWKNGKLDGITKGYHKNKQQFSELNYIDGNEDGIVKSWHENGTLSEICYYKNGLQHGALKNWNKEGQLIYHFEYKNGFRCGKSLYYFEKNKQVKEEYNYIEDGLLDGIFRKWDINGTLREEINYKRFLKHGPYKYWDKNGKLIEEGDYNKGSIVYTVIY